MKIDNIKLLTEYERQFKRKYPGLGCKLITMHNSCRLDFDVLVDGKIINSYTADGILVCTPTGSTAYNLSCGGPIVDPTAKILTLTPIAPHTVINRSIVLSDDSTVEIRITEIRDNTTSFVLYDGHPIEVFNGDVIKIKKSDKLTKIIKLEDTSFIDTIRENIN